MNLQGISIGRAPDFILKSGQMIYHHKVVLEITPTGNPPYKLTMDHVSMHQLIRCVKEVLEGIGWGIENTVKWDGLNESLGSMTGKLGSATINYRLPEFIPTKDQGRLRAGFYEHL